MADGRPAGALGAGPSERGFVLVLGLVVLLVVAAGVLATTRLAVAVRERIRLQDAADAAAYSLAVLEARALNLAALANRAAVAATVDALEAESVLSSATLLEGVLGVTAETLVAIAATPGAGAALAPASATAGRLHDSARAWLDGELERAVPDVVALRTLEARLLVAASLAVVAATAAQVARGVPELVRLTDPAATPAPADVLARTAGVASFLGALEPSSVRAGGGSAEAARAARAFAELVAASRVGSSRPAFLLDRPLGAAATAALGPVLEQLDGVLAGALKGALGDLTHAGASELGPDGGSLLAHDTLGGSFLGALGPSLPAMPTLRASVTSAPQQGRHCRYAGELRWHCLDEAGRHLWRAPLGLAQGLGPYLSFRTPSRAAPGRDSGEPEVWVVLWKQRPWALGDSTIPFGDARPAGPPRLVAVARAQVYYHRPGAWREPPNLFNPFWAARLAPAEEAAAQLGAVSGR